MRMSMVGLRWAVAALALVALAACGDGEGGNGALAALGVKDGASRGVAKSAQASPDKDVSIALSTGALLQVPKGAVDKSLTVTMERPADAKAVDLVQRFKTDQDRIVSAPYVLKPHGTKFNEEVSVTLPLSKMGTREEVEVAWLEDEDDTEWKKLGVAKSDGKSATITLKHFSVLVVVEDASDLRAADEPDAQPDANVAALDASGGGTDAGAGGDTDGAKPDMDASISVPAETGSGADSGSLLDAGTAADSAVGLDAVAPGLEDASAQLDAGPQLDGFVPPDPGDTGAQLPDAGSATVDSGAIDASGPPDAAVDPTQFAQNFYNKLKSCGYVTQTGGYSLTFGPDSIQQCDFNCYAGGTCEDAMGAYCSFPIGDASGPSPGFSACFAACRAFTCSAGGSATRCNGGEPECPDGDDERYCTGTFACGAEIVGYASRCNTYVDCLDGSDEQGCFTCDGGGTVLPPEAVCDFVRNCNDGSDEPASCAKVALACGPAT